jgi:hypothetical protein
MKKNHGSPQAQAPKSDIEADHLDWLFKSADSGRFFGKFSFF